MDTTKKQLVKQSSTALSKALRTADNKLALREVAQLTINKILDMREEWNNAALNLASARNSLKWLEKEYWVTNPFHCPVIDTIHEVEKKKLKKAIQSHIEECEKVIAETPKLPMLNMLQATNETDLLDTLQLLIINVVKFHHTTDKMGQNEIFECAFRIMNVFKGLTLEDVALCLYQAQNGAYGNVFNRIDGAVIINWLHQYQGRMQALGMERELQRHIKGKGETYRRGSDYRTIEPRKLRDLL